MINTRLRDELLKRYRADQAAARARSGRLPQIHRRNTAWFWSVVREHGWLSAHLVGKDGEEAAWLIVQNATDTTLQRACIRLLRKMRPTPARRQFLAYLTDALLVANGELQRYGTQYRDGTPCPVERPASLPRRRKQMNLSTVEEYHRVMTAYLGDAGSVALRRA